MKRIAVIVGLVPIALLASPVMASPGTLASSRAYAELARMPRTSNSDWRLNLDERTGAPSSLFGSRSAPLPHDPGGPSATVRRFLREHGALFQVRDGLDDFRLDRMVEQRGIRHYHMQQLYRGLPVFGRSYNVSLDELDRVVAVTGSTEPDLSGDVAASLSVAAATRMARASHPGARLVPGTTPRLGVHVLDRVATPAWEIDMDSGAATESYRVRIDARTGAILARESTSPHYDGLAYAFPSNPLVSSPAQVVLPRLLGTGTSLTGDLVEVHTLSGAPLTATNGNFLVSSPDSIAFAQAHAYYHADRFLAYLRGLGYEGPAARMILNVNNPMTNIGRAYYNGTNKQLYFSRGASNVAYDAGVIAHESWHFVAAELGFSFGGSLSGPTEAGALQEGLAQYFEAAYSGQVALSEWGQSPATCGLTGWQPRVANNPSSYFKMPKYNQLVVCGWVTPDDHTNGLIITGAMWDLRTAIGAATADQLALEALPFLPATPSMGCYFDALFIADGLFHGMQHGMPIVQIRANRYLNCKPIAEIVGPSTLYLNEPVTFQAEGVAGTNCGIVDFSVATWRRRPECTAPPCAAWTDYEDDGGYTVSDATPNNFDLQAVVTDAWGRSNTTPIRTIRVYQRMVPVLSGPTAVDVTDCTPETWTGSATGHGPFTFQWSSPYGNRSGPTYTVLPTTNFTLTLVVTDVDGQQMSVSRAVAVTGTCDLGGDVVATKIEGARSVLSAGETELQLTARAGTHGRLEVCDVAGRRAAVPFDGMLATGTQRVRWNTGALPSGVYFYRFTVGDRKVTQRFVLVH